MFCVVKLVLLLVTVCTARELSDEELFRLPKLYHLDDYDRCLSQTEGIYCLGAFELVPKEQPNFIYDLIKERLKKRFSFDRRILHRGYCLNKRCPSDEKNSTLRFEQCADKTVTKLALTARLKEFSYCTTHAERKAKLSEAPDLPQKLFLYVLFSILFLNVLGTIYDVYGGDKKNKYLVAWSIPANWRDLTTVDDKPSLFGPIQSCKIILHCIVIYTHANLVQIMGYMHNPESLEKGQDGFVNILIRNGTSLVQVFILISSFFVGYNVLQTAKRSTISAGVIIKWILKRIFRLAPVYLLLTAYSATWWPRYGDGPFWSLVEAESQICRDKFWTHVLFINNFVQPSQLCMVQSWAIAADVQLYLAALLLTLMFIRLKVPAVPVLGAMFVASCLLNITLAYVGGLVPMIKVITPELLRTQFRGSRSFFHLHISPWSNLPACFLGLLLAHIYFEQKTKAKDKLEDGKTKSNGIILNGLKNENGAVVNGNGEIVNGNGKLNGSGILVNINGAIVNENYPTVNENGALVNGNGALVNGNGAFVNGKAAAVKGNFRIVNGNDTLVNGNGALVNGNGAFVNGKAPVVNENNRAVNGNGALINGNGAYVNGNSTLLNGSGGIVNGNGNILNGTYEYVKKNGMIRENSVSVLDNGEADKKNGECINENGLLINGRPLNTENGLRNRIRVSYNVKSNYTKNSDYICEKNSNGVTNGVNNQNGHSNCNGYVNQNGFLENKDKSDKKAPFLLRYAHFFTIPVLIVWIIVGSRVAETEAPVVVALYVGLERLMFSLTFAMQLLQVITVKGPWARAFSWRGWAVPARLVMSVAMVHWCVNMTINSGRLHPVQYSLLYVSIDWLATLFYSYMIAIPICILVELPMKKAIDALVS